MCRHKNELCFLCIADFLEDFERSRRLAHKLQPNLSLNRRDIEQMLEDNYGVAQPEKAFDLLQSFGYIRITTDERGEWAGYRTGHSREIIHSRPKKCAEMEE